MVEIHLADDITWSVARLTEIEELLEPDELARRVGPSARSPAGVELAGLIEADLIGLNAERGEPAGGAIGEHDPHQFPTVRDVVVKARLHHHFFHRCRETFGTIGIDV